MTINLNDYQKVVCPDGYQFVKPHYKNGQLIIGYCRKKSKSQEREKQKNLARETIEAIPFGFDAVVGYDYFKYGRDKTKKMAKRHRKHK